MLPGVIGTLQANEALKILVGYGEPLVGRLLTFDASSTEFGQLKLKRDTGCATCGNGLSLAREGTGGAGRALESGAGSPNPNAR